MDVGDALTTKTREDLGNIFNKYSLKPGETHVWFAKAEHHKFSCEIVCHLERNLYIKVRSTTNDVYVALSDVLHKLDGKIRRHKRRIDDHHKHHDNHKYFKLSAQDYTFHESWETENTTEAHPPTIAEKMTDIPVLSVEGALMRLDLADAPVFFFRRSAEGQINCVYRRGDGNIGWLSPEGT
jgi:ribosomal subunit interface protein